MRFETIDALVLLVSTYTTSIEATGTVIPEETVALISTDPFKACEALNELAVATSALTPETDAALAAIYESMDAADARSTATPNACEKCAVAFERVHVEQPEPEPEPEPEPTISPEAEEAAEDGAAPAETEPDVKKPAKRRGRKPKKAADPAEAESSAAAEAEAPAEEAKPAGAPFEGDVLTIDQALAILGCSRPKLTKMIEAGELPAYKKGRSWQVSAAAVLDKAAGL